MARAMMNWSALVPPVVQPRVVAGAVQDVGVRLADTTAAMPVPLSDTGEPLTLTLAVMVTVPVFAPVLVGVNVTLIVQVPPAANVAPQVPPAAPAGRAN